VLQLGRDKSARWAKEASARLARLQGALDRLKRRNATLEHASERLALQDFFIDSARMTQLREQSEVHVQQLRGVLAHGVAVCTRCGSLPSQSQHLQAPKPPS
jgi:hypothetical protein